jgi:hypothetical protein
MPAPTPAFKKFVTRLKGMSQKRLKEMLERRHPFYDCRAEHWDFMEDTYDGGRDWFDENIFKFYKEGVGEYADRVMRAYRPNHTREVVDLVNKYLFKAEIARQEGDAPDYIKKFWACATLTRSDITDLMRLVSGKSSTFGKPWVVVDSTVADGVATKADEAAGDARVYAYILKPQDVLDMAFDKTGDLNWLMHVESARDDEDPLLGSGAVEVRWRLWTRDHWALFGMKTEGGKKTYYVVAAGEHNLGVVPIIGAPHVISDSLYWSPGLIDDVAYMDRAIANYLSNIDAIIQDQTFSQLVIPAQAIMPGAEGEDKMTEMGTKRIFTYDAQAGVAPQFISPDPRQAGLILAVIARIVGEIYQTVGMSGERTKQDNATGIDNSSGVAKAYDFERMNAMLAAKAKSMEFVENKLVAIVSLYNGVGDPATIFTDPKMKLVCYPGSFDVRGLYDEFEIASSLAMMGAPDEVRRQQMEQLIDKLFPSLPQKLVQKMKDDMGTNWPPADPTLQSTGAMPPFSPKPKPAPPGSGSKQGQNNKDAPKTSNPKK